MTAGRSGPKNTATIDREALTRALKLLAAGVEARSAQRGATAVRLRFSGSRLELTTSSKRASIRTSLKLLRHNRTGELCVRHSALQKAIAACRGETVQLRMADGERLEIVSGRRTLRLSGFGTDELGPYLPDGNFAPLACFEAAELANALAATARCASADFSRPVLNSVGLDFDEGDRVVVVATDSYRLAAVEVDAELRNEHGGLLLLARAGAQALARELRSARPEHVEIATCEDRGQLHVRASYDGVHWTIASPAGRFPDWRELISVGGDPIELDTKELREALEGVAAIGRKVSDNSNSVVPLRLELGKKGARLHYRDSDVGELIETLPSARYEGAKLTIGFNPTYLSDMLAALGDEEINGTVQAAGKPALFTAGRTRYLLMPVRLQR